MREFFAANGGHRHRHLRRFVAFEFDLGETKVEDLGLTARVDEDVGRLQIAMNDSFRVRRFECVGDLSGEIEQHIDVERARANLVGQRFAFEQLHHDEVLRLVLFDREDRADVRMIQCRRGARFALKAEKRRRVLREFSGKKLQRDMAAEFRVLCFVDNAHAAGAELRRDTVMRYGLADHREP